DLVVHLAPLKRPMRPPGLTPATAAVNPSRRPDRGTAAGPQSSGRGHDSPFTMITASPFSPSETEAARALIALALREDLGTGGDLTSQALIPAGLTGKAAFVSRRDGVIAGLALLPMINEMATGEVGS